MTSRRTTLTAVDRQGFHAPLVAYYGSLTDETRAAINDYAWVTDTFEAEQVIPTLIRRVPVVKVLAGEFQGDYIVMVPVPYILPESFGDDEYTFELEA
jgi:hypothetical protein